MIPAVSQPADPYAVLGIAPTADAATIKAAYKLRALEHHPDRPGGSTVRMQEITRAYGVLADVTNRAAWDLAAKRSQEPQGPSTSTQRRTGWKHAPEARQKPAAGAPSSPKLTDVASRLVQWAAVAVVLSGLQQLTIGGGSALMAAAAGTLALRVFAGSLGSCAPFWPGRDARHVFHQLRRLFAGAV